MEDSRRQLLRTSIGVGIATICCGVADAAEGDARSSSVLKQPPSKVDVTVKIVWVDKGGPVAGAKVFDHATNKLIGTTDATGTLKFQGDNGTVVRLVEPKYGQQQALRLVQGELVPGGGDVRVAIMGEGWTIN